VSKSKLRKELLKIRKLKNKQNIKIKFNKVFNLIKKNFLLKDIGGYFPVNYEADDLDILKEFNKKNYQISLPVIKKNFEMDFYKWSFNNPLKINKYGIPEPEKIKLTYPDVILVPLIAFDKKLNRLGYGGGYYDRLIQKLSEKKKILKIGLALSFQKINNVPINKYDKKLDYIVTDKYII
jgi:5-formyltetrahydrofolate cyclo-ligase